MEEKELKPVEKTKKKKKVSKLRVFLVVMLVLSLSSLAGLYIYYSLPEQKGQYHEYGNSITINNIEWIVQFEKHSYTKNVRILKIHSEDSYNERTSSYYEELALRYGSNDVYVIHKISRVGTPIGNDWYQIEETEQIINSFDTSEILYTRQIRYQEKLVFNVSDTYYYPEQ